MKKPTVVVVGLLPGQAAHIERRCPSVRLRFVESRGNIPCLPSGDHIVLLIKFVRHLWTDAALKRWPRERVHYHLGGVSELADKILRISKHVEQKNSLVRGVDFDSFRAI